MTAIIDNQQLRLAPMSVLELEELILQRTCGIVAGYLPLFGLEVELAFEHSSQLIDF